jgi:hypothetical protein
MVWMGNECGSPPAMITHDGVRLNRTFTRIEISLRVSSRSYDVVGAHARSKRADSLIDFGLRDNRLAAVYG